MKIKGKRMISVFIILAISGGLFLSMIGEEKGRAMGVRESQRLKQTIGEINGEWLSQITEQGDSNVMIENMGGTETEQTEQVVEETDVQEEMIELPEMEWALFLETEVSYGVAGNIYERYGIYGNFTEKQKEGEEIYFSLHKAASGRIPKLASYVNWQNRDEEYRNHEEWINCQEEVIVDCSTDLEWIITREGEIERWYKNGKKVKEFKFNPNADMSRFVQKREGEGFVPLEEEIIAGVQETMEKLYEMQWYSEYDRSWSCFNPSGKMFAASNKIVWDEPSAINIYSLEDGKVDLLYELAVPISEAKWPIEISQVEGDINSGWIVFSYGDETFRMTYPDGKMEKIGEFMYRTSYSPDGKYLVYCTGNRELLDIWMYWVDIEPSRIEAYFHPMRERWQEIPQGWYVMNLETGEKSYIPVPYWTFDTGRPLTGGRCTWVEKDKLMELLER